MLSEKCIDAYEQYFPDDVCAYDECTGDIVIERNTDGMPFYNPDNESDTVFLDRLERSRLCGRNLFYEEWKQLQIDENAYY